MGRRKVSLYKKFDILIYGFLILFFLVLGKQIFNFQNEKASKAEIYVDGRLKYVYPLEKNEKNVFVDTSLGGVNVQFENNMVRVTSSNSPLKLCVKQGWIKSPGDVIIGVPDRLLVKIIGNKSDSNENDVDFILR